MFTSPVVTLYQQYNFNHLSGEAQTLHEEFSLNIHLKNHKLVEKNIDVFIFKNLYIQQVEYRMSVSTQ